MDAEVISVGTELTTGAKLDTNSQWLSEELAAVGVSVKYHTTVADDLAANVAVFRQAVDRTDVVLITGGLGPTQDDLTRQALADMLGVELVVHEPSLKFIKQLFAKRNRTMAPRNAVQAMFPAGSEPLANPVGTAPGIWMEIPRDQERPACRLAAMPGVPSEMKLMFRQQVLPKLQSGGHRSHVIRLARINCFGPGESEAEQWLGDLTARGRDPEVGITVSQATITLRITACGESEADCEAKIASTKHLIRQRMGTALFGEEDEELQHVVVRLLSEQGRTLATAESGTGGLVAHWLTEVDGSQEHYLGGVVVPTSAAKRQWLEVTPELLQTAGAISADVARAMAEGCRKQFGTDFALAVTERPRVDPAHTISAVPTAFFALAGQGTTDVKSMHVGGDPSIIPIRIAKAALNLLRLRLIE